MPRRLKPDSIFFWFYGTAEAVPFPVKVKSRIKNKINVKGVGQECPTHTVYLADAETKIPRVTRDDKLARFPSPNPALGLLFERYPVIITDGLIAD